MPFGPNLVKEMSQLVFLWTISEELEGITGYDLKENYNVKQTNVYRTLGEMEEQGYIIANEKIVKGRAQKLFSITEKGKVRLKDLREKWTTKIAFLSDIAPPRPLFASEYKGRHRNFFDSLEEIKSKEEMLQYLHYLQRRTKRHEQFLEERLQRTTKNTKILAETVEFIETQKDYDTKEVKELIKELIEKYHQKP
jgi:DNA-binding PadR family transcriptional regulator